MAIKFNCPHCQKPIQTAKDELAGKRAPCPGCKKILTIPAPVAAPADIEAFAAAALIDQPEEIVEPAAPTTIDFVCEYCDEKMQVSTDLAGKKTPCPHCRRIVKVPVPELANPKDWRKVKSRLPSAARQDLGAAPEGTWSTAQAVGVSAKSLMEAQAAADRRAPATWQDWAKRGGLAAGVLAVAGVVAFVVLRVTTTNQEHRAYAQALKYVEGKATTDPSVSVGVLQGLGEYEVRASDVQNAMEKAKDHFAQAYLDIRNVRGELPQQRDWLRIDLALSQVELGGMNGVSPKQEERNWDKTLREIERTLRDLESADARIEGPREVTRKLLAKGQGPGAVSLGSLFPDEAPQTVAIIGLEMLHAKQAKEAQRSAEQATRLFKDQLERVRRDKNQTKVPLAPSSLLALWVALGKNQEASGLAPPPDANKLPHPLAIMGIAEGLAWKGDFDEARKLARSARLPEDRLKAVLGVATAAMAEAPETRGATAVRDAILLLKSDWKDTTVPSALLFRLVRLGMQAGLASEIEEIIPRIGDEALRGRAQLDLLRYRLTTMAKPVDPNLITIVGEDTPWNGLAHKVVARHNSRFGGPDFRKVVDAWPDPLKPLGSVGIALGLQDQKVQSKR